MQRTLKRESKVLEIAERETIATDRCGPHYEPVRRWIGGKKKRGKKWFPFLNPFFFFFFFFFPPFPKSLLFFFLWGVVPPPFFGFTYILFFFIFFFFFFFFFFSPLSKGVGVDLADGDWASIGSGDDRRPPSRWVRRAARGVGQSVREGEGEVSLFLSLEPTIPRGVGLGGFDFGTSVVPKPSCGGPR